MGYPLQLYFCAIFLVCLIFEAVTRLQRPWSIPAIGVYLTVLGWYFVDPFQFPEKYRLISSSILGFSYLQVAIFLIALRWLTPVFAKQFCKLLDREALIVKSPSAAGVFKLLLWLWAPLLGVGIWRMNGDVFGALFPLDARAGTNMWMRGALGGTWDSLVAAGSYIYQLICGLMGVTLILQRQSAWRTANIVIFALSLPFFLLSGTRSIFLAASSPLFFTYLLAGRQRLRVRVIVILLSALVMNLVLLQVITNRGTGFRYLVDEQAKAEKEFALGQSESSQNLGAEENNNQNKQVGLNMIEELCFINEYTESGIFEPAFGKRYLIELSNAIPRALWPNKPMIGIDYAIWRGFGIGGNAEGIGVNATISTGMIGGGVMNFGQWAGPFVAGALMALWAAILTRWWLQRASVLRLCMFMAGLGLTFNLGRDITLLVLWPIVFGIIIVKVIESFSKGGGIATASGQSSRWKSAGPPLRQS